MRHLFVTSLFIFLIHLLYGQSSPSIKYAKGFDIVKENGKTIVTVKNPWAKGEILATYVLTRRPPEKNEMKVPLGNIAVFSATQLDAMEQLEALQAVTGISEAKYIRNGKVKKLLNEGKIKELAAGGAYFTEKILKERPDAVFYSPYENSRPVPEVLHSIPFIPYLDYLEPDPLGRAEWIKFTAAFLNKEALADSLFDSIEARYLRLKKLTVSVKNRPTVFSDKFFNGQWFVPGGKSYVARLFADAGAHYVFDYIPKEAGVPLDFETVWKKAKDADYWRITGSPGNPPSYEELAEENYRYTLFKAFKEHHILYCDSQTTAYFEKGPLTPYLILADFIKAFHPELLPGYRPVYYKLLEHE